MAPTGVNQLSHPCIYERKSRFMKWLSKLFKSGPSRGNAAGSNHHPQLIGDESMIWRAPPRSLDDRSRAQKEKEELDHAIGLSLAEDLRRRSGYRWQAERDEELARSLQDSSNPPLYPPYASAPAPYYPYGQTQRICGSCKHDIHFGNYLGCMGTYFHPQCFCCRSCSRPIVENVFSLSGRDPYHKSCFKELAHPKCEVCHQFIPTNRAGLIEYRCHPFWTQKYCPSHEHDNTARCCSCECLEGAPKQADGKTCGYCVMRYMKEICEDSSLAFRTKYASRGKKKMFYTQMELDEVRDEWACHVLEWI